MVPVSSVAFRSALAAINFVTVAICPFALADIKVRVTPASTKAVVIVVCPFSFAKSKAVLPSSFVMFRSAPASINFVTTSSCPL